MHLSLKRWCHGAALATTTLLAACGGGTEQTAAATIDLLDVAQTATIQAVSAAPEAGARLEGTVALAKISETRISRTVYEYAFSVTMRAGAAGARAAMARLLTVGSGTEIVNATVYIGDIAAGGTATSRQRITLRHDRTRPFRMEDLRFQLTGTAVEGRIVDGYIVGAQVYWDCNDNHQIDDATEPWTVSTAGGKYVIEPSPATACVLRAIVPSWAVDEATNAIVTQAFRMSALAGKPNVISPFTTLVTDGGYSEAQLKTLFNLKGSVDADPVASGVQHDQALAGVIATGLKAAGGSAMTLAPDNRKLMLQDVFRLYPPDAFTDATLATSNNDYITRLLDGLPTWSFIQAETKLPEHRFVLRDPLKSGLCNALIDSATCEKRKTFIRGALGLAEKYHAASGLNIDWSLIPPEERRALHAADTIPTNADVEAVRKELLAYSLAQQKAIEALRQSADSQMFKNMLAAQSDIAAKYADAVVAGYAVSNRAFDATVTTYRAATGPRQLNTLLKTLFVKKRKATALALLVNSPACLATLTSDVLKPLAEAPGDALEVTDAVLTFGLDGAACIASLVKGGDFKDWLTVASGSYKITINRAKLNMDDQQLADVLGYLSAVLDFAGAVVDLTPGTTPIAQKAMKWTALAVKSGNFVIGGLAAYLNQTVKDRKAYDQLIQAMDDGSNAQRIQFEAFGQMIFEARVNPYIVPDVFAGYIGEGGVTNVSIASLRSRNADETMTAGMQRSASLVPGAAAAFTPAQHLQGHGGVQLYEWNFGDGSASVTTAEPSTVTHTYSWPGTYVVSLRTVSVGQTQFDGRAAERYEGVVTSNVTVQPNAGDQAWLADDFSGQAINGTTWTVNGYPGAPRIGPVTIDANGIAQFAAWGAMDTRGKLVFSGPRIVIEARMAGTGPSRDTRIALVDVSDPNNTIQVGDTSYCAWGMYVHAFGAFRQSGPNGGCGANIPVPATGGSTSQFEPHRVSRRPVSLSQTRLV